MLYLLALAAAFDLVCAGGEVTFPPEQHRAYEIVYRVDLDRGKWCEGECETVRDIVRTEDEMLVLEDRRYTRRRLAFVVWTSVDLSTGAHLASDSYGATVIPLGIRRQGRCERADFSGFPTDSGTRRDEAPHAR